MVDFIYYLVGLVILGLFWGLVSYLAYHLSVVIKRRWPLGAIAGISMFFSFCYSLLLAVWFVWTAVSIFMGGQILLGIVFVLFLGGFMVAISMTLFNLVASIPLMLLDKLEERLSEIGGHEEPGLIDSKQIPPYTHPTSTDEFDTLFDKAKRLIEREGKASPALFQREFHIGYEMAVRMMYELEEQDLIGPADGAKPRKVKIGKHKVHSHSDDELADWETIKDKE